MQVQVVQVPSDPNDDPLFLDIVRRIIRRAVDEECPRCLRIIRIARWFDHKWLRYSGYGRVRYKYGEGAFFDQRDTALEPFWSDRLTFPPFTPKRVLAEEFWDKNKEDEYEKCEPAHLVHPRSLCHSSANLHRRAALQTKSTVVVWFSSHTGENDTGSVMLYSVKSRVCKAWYASFRKMPTWSLYKTKGISMDELLQVTTAL